MNIIIADNDLSFKNTLEKDILNYFSIFYDNSSINIIWFNNDLQCVSLLESLEILFVEIDFNTKLNGLNLAKYLKKLFPKVIVIFTSFYDELVFPALSIGFFQFIRKSKYNYDAPIVFHQVNQFLIDNRMEIIINCNGRKSCVKLNQIIYILSIGHELFIKTTTSDYSILSSLDKFMQNINLRDFVQIERNLIVNFNFMKEVCRSKVTMAEDKAYVVGRKYQDNLIYEYEEFLLR